MRLLSLIHGTWRQCRQAAAKPGDWEDSAINFLANHGLASCGIYNIQAGVPGMRATNQPELFNRRVGPERYLFKSLSDPFSAELETDGDGLVLRYSGLFHRACAGGPAAAFSPDR
jgi:hypothetical protein